MMLSLEKIRMDGGTQPRAEIDLAVVADYAEMMQTGAKFPPVVVFYDGSDYWLADGFHRVGAAFQAEREVIECEVKQGTVEDAQWYSYGVNKEHGLRRTNNDKQRAVQAALKHTRSQKLSDNQIAQHCGVGQPMVSRWRHEMESSYLINKIDAKTVERGGSAYTMDTSRIGKRQKRQLERFISETPYCGQCGEYHDSLIKCRTENSPAIEIQEKETGLLQIPEKPKSFITLSEWEKMSERKKKQALNFPRSNDFRFNQTNDNVEWAMWTWNPVTGCLHNCAYCYARDIANRFYEQGFEPVFLPERLNAPINTRVPERAKTEPGYGNVFTCSMADLFGKWVPQEWIDAVLGVMHEQAQWNYLVLTKFPQRLSEQNWPQNTWVGATIDRQARVKETLKSFDKVKRKSNAAITWLSLEPLLEPLKFDSLAMFDMVVIGGASASSQTPEFMPPVRWIAEIMSQADRDGCAVYLKTNGRPREYPGHKPSPELVAPQQFQLVTINAK